MPTIIVTCLYNLERETTGGITLLPSTHRPISSPAKDFDARRAVKGTTGERVVVERTKDPLGRPSTVVKKITSQSRLVM